MRCRSYINKYFKFINGGKNFECNICYSINEVPDSYYCKLGLENDRNNIDKKNKLKFETIDFELINKEISKFYVVILFEMTEFSPKNGFLKKAMKQILKSLKDKNNSNIKIALLGFDYAIHFFCYNENNKKLNIQVLSDLNNLYDVMRNFDAFTSIYEKVLSNDSVDFNNYIKNNISKLSCFGSAIEACVHILVTNFFIL